MTSTTKPADVKLTTRLSSTEYITYKTYLVENRIGHQHLAYAFIRLVIAYVKSNKLEPPVRKLVQNVTDLAKQIKEEIHE